MPSPLYARAQQELQQAALREFRASNLERIIASVQAQIPRPGASIAGAVVGAVSSMANPQRTLLNAVRRTPFGEVIGAVERYAKSGSNLVVDAFLDALGPLGLFVKDVVGVGIPKLSQEELTNRTIQQASDLLRSFGWSVKPPTPETPVGDFADDLDLITETLGQPTEGTQWTGRGEDLPFGISRTKRDGTPREWIEVQSRGIRKRGPDKGTQYDRKRRWPVDDPIVTGEMVRTPESTNVYEVGYDIEHKALYVRYQQAPDRTLLGKRMPTHRPGPLYEYHSVPDELAHDLLMHAKQTGHAGDWIWDHIRVRGSQVSHQYAYELAGVGVDGYVPRQAWYGVAQPQGYSEPHIGEWYKPRNIFTTRNEWRTSNRTDWQGVATMPVEHWQSMASGRRSIGPTTMSPNKRSRRR